MGHVVFIVLHVIAFAFGMVLLFVTVPLHLIYAVARSGRDDEAPRYSTHWKCPDCQELVLREARVCKHCGARLVPESEQRDRRS